VRAAPGASARIRDGAAPGPPGQRQPSIPGIAAANAAYATCSISSTEGPDQDGDVQERQAGAHGQPAA
jgi:hypothetical protein